MAATAEGGEDLRDDKMKIITEVYKPLLLNVLDTRDIMERMKGHLKADDRFTELLELSQRDPRQKVTEQFLDILNDLPDQRGIFQAFMEALPSECKYLRDHLDGSSNFDTKRLGNYQHFFKLYADRLQKIVPSEMLPHMEPYLTDRDKEAIVQKAKFEGDLEGASQLLLRLDRKSEDAFDQFIKALGKTGNTNLANELNELKKFVIGLDEEPQDADGDDDSPAIERHIGSTCEYHVDNKTNELNDEDGDRVVELQLRDYQEEVLAPAMKGENVMVVLPTGTGKTEVAIALIERRFLTYDQPGASNYWNPKVVFVVSKVPLVTQQKDRCLKYLRDRCSVAGVSGEELNESPLDKVLDEFEITVLTAQKLINALDDDHSGVKLSDISLLILDECHHCQKSNPYNVLMAMYRDMKLNAPKARRPQILGLTASPGVGNAKDMLQAEDHVIKLCANLDCRIARVTNHVRSIKNQSGAPKEIQIIVKGRSVQDPFSREVNPLMEDIENIIFKSEVGRRLTDDDAEFSKMTTRRGQQAYEQAVVNLTRKIRENVEEENTLRKLLACAHFLREYNNSLFINRDARTLDAIAYMDKYVEEQEATGVSGGMDIRLIKMYRDKRPMLARFADLHVSDNPVLNEFRKWVKKEYEENPESLSIVFTKTRESAKALAAWLNEDTELQHLKLNADFLIGGGGQGMTSNDQNILLKMFREQERKIIVATSVAEEGLDIEKCNLVFRYNYVTSDIGHVQTKGRSRAFQGKFYLIVNSDLQLQDRELRNIIRVKMMEETIRDIDKMDRSDFQSRVTVEQKEDQKARRMEKEIKDALKSRKVETADITLHCTKCFETACTSGDIRAIKNQHHVVVNDLFRDKIELIDLEKKKQRVIDGWKYQQGIHCAKCQKKWGSMTIYQGQELPLIAAHNFIMKDIKRRKYLPKKWSDAPFAVIAIDIEDLLKKMNNLDEDDEQEESDEDNVMLDYSNIGHPD